MERGAAWREAAWREGQHGERVSMESVQHEERGSMERRRWVRTMYTSRRVILADAAFASAIGALVSGAPYE